MRGCVHWMALLLFGGVYVAAAAEPAATHAMTRASMPQEKPARAPKPSLAIGATLDGLGRLWLARVENQHLLVSHSDDGGLSFSSPVVVTPTPENISADGENRPGIAVAKDGSVLLVWVQGLPQRFTANVRFARSTDGGKRFSSPITLNDDNRIAGHSFTSLAIDGDGRVAVVWLDGRDRDAAREQGRAFAGSSLYAALSSDNGASFAANRQLARHTCECCRTALAWTPQGPVAFWRNLYDGNIRDFALADLDRATVRRASDDEWQIAACPHHGGGIAADQRGGLHLAWFTNGTKRQGLFYRRIEAGSEAGSTGAPMAFGNADAQAGHPAVAVAGDRVLLTWREFDGRAYSAQAMQSHDGGVSWGAPQRLAESRGSADYPLPLSDGKQLKVVWRSAAEGVRVWTLADASSEAIPVPIPAAMTGALR